ncbi:DUF2309 domain-containing protein [Novosphingobium percolationis]|uniref:DUF2309 domain-containing protein n=1 Tax=Novosphingobium percolationis TaxID=2871811 RepID=UPI001CD61269|nr:DUF2309 domain-containing protein [Novosphingobium percolationis]
MSTITAAAPSPFSSIGLARAGLEAQLALAAQTVAPLWPLDSAIAVNPLSGFEDLPFESALEQAARLFGARTSLPLAQWRALLAEGRIDEVALRKTAVAALGGLDQAFAQLGPDLNAYDLLLARLTTLPVATDVAPRPPLSPAMAILARWLAVFFDRAAPPLAGRSFGLWRCLSGLLRNDTALRALATGDRLALLDAAPADPFDLLAEVLDAQAVPPVRRLDQLRALFTRLPGWSAHVRWRTDHAEPAQTAKAPATMADLAALVALASHVAGEDVAVATPAPAHDGEAVTQALLAHFQLSPDAAAQWSDEARSRLALVAGLDEGRLGLLFQQAAEASVIAQTGPALERASRAAATPASARPDAQLVFCIDVRSEPMRRAIEAQGAFETFGYAGFFGLPVAIQPILSAAPRKQLPVLLSPAHHVCEAPLPGRTAQADSIVARRACAHDAQSMLDATKSGATGFATAEAVGPLAAVALLARTLAPRLSDRLARMVLGEPDEVLAPHASNDDEPSIPLADKVRYARSMFALTGLPARAARLVVLVGHGGHTTNNAFAASLDCGACGGHPGGPNARLMAGMLNDPAVREGLAEQGLALSPDTVFLAAQHDTTRDAVTVFDRHMVPASHREDLARLDEALAIAGHKALAERAQRHDRAPDDLLTGAAHWGEVRPEWGLSGNAAFIVGPRRLTAALDLEGGAFLHSYDWEQDKDGSALTAILTAPMVVAQWINCQYLFSTIDNAVFGAGDKITQNVVGGFGVVQGAGGDLCTGLPRQSLFRDDGTPYHVPRRLTVFVQSPLRRVEEIVFAHDGLSQLVENGWINLVVIDPWKHRAHHWQRARWVPRVC